MEIVPKVYAVHVDCLNEHLGRSRSRTTPDIPVGAQAYKTSMTGQSVWLGKSFLTAKEIYPTNLLIQSAVGEEEPWCLATSKTRVKSWQSVTMR